MVKLKISSTTYNAPLRHTKYHSISSYVQIILREISLFTLNNLFLLSFYLQKTYPVLPSKNFAQLRLFNTLDCNVTITTHNPELSFVLESMDMWEDKYVKANGEAKWSYTADFSKCNRADITKFNESAGISKFFRMIYLTIFNDI